MKDLAIRKATDADLAFIFSTWLRSYKSSSLFAKNITNQVYFDLHHKIIERILARPLCQVLVAHAAEDPNLVLGYLVYELWNDKPVIHYAFVKGQFRKLGIAKAMLTASQLNPNACLFSHWTKLIVSKEPFERFDVCELIRSRFPHFTYNPYAI